MGDLRWHPGPGLDRRQDWRRAVRLRVNAALPRSHAAFLVGDIRPHHRWHISLTSWAREARGAHDVSIVRVEQLSPFPYQECREEMAKWPNAQVIWAQEEAMNYGGWSYVRPRLENTVRSAGRPNASVSYVGRNPSAAPATGLEAVHKEELKELLNDAFSR